MLGHRLSQFLYIVLGFSRLWYCFLIVRDLRAVAKRGRGARFQVQHLTRYWLGHVPPELARVRGLRCCRSWDMLSGTMEP